MKKYQVSVVGEPEPVAPIQSSHIAAEFLKERWQDMEMRESMHALFLNSKNTVLRHEIIGVGGIASTPCDPRILFSYALTTPTCTGIILAHNHPSGNLRPSQQDADVTKKVRTGAEILDLKLLDHLILTPSEGYYSFADEGTI